MYKKFKNKEELKEFDYDFSRKFIEENNLDITSFMCDVDDETYLNELIRELENQGYNVDDLLESDEYYNILGHKNPRYHNLYIGKYYDDPTIPLAKVDGNIFALIDWDGEKFVNCRRAVDVNKNGKCTLADGFFSIKPTFDLKGNMVDFEHIEARTYSIDVNE